MNISTIPIPTKKAAAAIVAGLSSPAKMPGKAYGLPAAECKVGSKLRQIPGSTCSDCYACKGMYQFGTVQDAQYRRLESLSNPLWVPAMVKLVSTEKYFRWHDSGDLMSVEHLRAIVAVCEATPGTKHWLPTREKGILVQFHRAGGTIPDNLTLRVSAAMIDGEAPAAANTSTVHKDSKPIGKACNAYRTRKDGTMLTPSQYAKRPKGLDLGYCGKCRACWNPAVSNVSYPKH